MIVWKRDKFWSISQGQPDYSYVGDSEDYINYAYWTKEIKILKNVVNIYGNIEGFMAVNFIEEYENNQFDYLLAEGKNGEVVRMQLEKDLLVKFDKNFGSEYKDLVIYGSPFRRETADDPNKIKIPGT